MSIIKTGNITLNGNAGEYDIILSDTFLSWKSHTA